MGTIADKLTYLNNTKTAIKDAIVAKGVNVTDADTFRSYASKIGQIQTGSGIVAETKYGIGPDMFIGNPDANGVLQPSTIEGHLVLDGITSIGTSALRNAFAQNERIVSANLGPATSIENMGLSNAFYQAQNFTTLILSNVKTVGYYGLGHCCNGNKNFTTLDVSSVEEIGMEGFVYGFRDTKIQTVILNKLKTVDVRGLMGAFSLCKELVTASFDLLETLNTNSFQGIFDGCTALTSLSFPSLVNIDVNAFGSQSSIAAFSNSGITEIHFRADAQAAVEATTLYSTKWGATNAQIYYDL